jgi:hypothetical protein
LKSWFKPQYRLRETWGHTVEFKQPEFKSTDFGTSIGTDLWYDSDFEEIILWANETAQARRISYDSWQFKSKKEAEQFIMLYTLTWG